MTLAIARRPGAAEVRRQKRQVRREIAADARKKLRAQIKALREQIREVKRSRRGRAAEVREQCRVWRASYREEAQRRRAELREILKGRRREVRDACLRARTRVPEEIAAEVEELRGRISELKIEAAEAKRLGIAIERIERDRRTPAERRSEAEDEVRANIAAELLPVFEQVKGKIRAGARSSLTEAFLQWVHDHSAEVAEILYSGEAETLRELERNEAALSREYARIVRRGGRASPELLARLEAAGVGSTAPESTSIDDTGGW